MYTYICPDATLDEGSFALKLAFENAQELTSRLLPFRAVLPSETVREALIERNHAVEGRWKAPAKVGIFSCKKRSCQAS